MLCVNFSSVESTGSSKELGNQESQRKISLGNVSICYFRGHLITLNNLQFNA